MDMTPELAEEMSAAQPVTADTAPESLYLERMRICGSCPSLAGGMTCGFCGCFVAFRARRISAFCPGLPRRW